jgi:hypothetical protein
MLPAAAHRAPWAVESHPAAARKPRPTGWGVSAAHRGTNIARADGQLIGGRVGTDENAPLGPVTAGAGCPHRFSGLDEVKSPRHALLAVGLW